MAIRAYLDSSGKLNESRITLAAVAATDEVWLEFENSWQRVLDSTSPRVGYVHMAEISGRKEEYQGWTHDKAFVEVVNPCVRLMANMDKTQLRMFYCKVDLDAWRKLRALTYQMPEPVDLCNSFCSELVLRWYLDHYSDFRHNVKYFFDRGEDFYEPFYQKWNREKDFSKQSRQWSLWDLIDEVAPAVMEKTPGIQAADIVAWAINRESFTQDGDMAAYLGHILRTVVPSYQVVWNEINLMRQFSPLLIT